ncbi:MAG TPA: hypothetical protein VGT08_00600 [Terracidiphilus sp.]|nr:hypothetical protein [Terracidiphilus sp.]
MAVLATASWLYAQTPPQASDAQAPQTVPTAPSAQTAEIPATEGHPIAIVPLDSKIPGFAAEVTGALRVNNGRALIAANGAITAGSQSTQVTLPYRGTLLICAYTIVKLAADSSISAGQVPGLMMAMDHGAVEMSLATSRDSDILLTPDFRILIAGPGAAELKVRLGPHGDTCVDNAGANAPYVLVSSVFDGGAYRVQPGQRVMFQHGSLHEVVDQEKESCGCPPAEPKGNDFPVAQSEGLAPMPKPVPTSPSQNPTSTQPAVAPLVYNSAEHTPQPVSLPEPASAPTASGSANATAPQPTVQKKPGFFKRVGRLFRRIFGAE